MKFRDLHIQTQREAPNNARSQGQAFLVRAGYVTREGGLLPLGEACISRLKGLARTSPASFFSRLSLSVLDTDGETVFPLSTGAVEVIHCPACRYTARSELARFRKPAPLAGDPEPVEKVHTPDCASIEALAAFLIIPKEKTAKAMMFTRPSDGRFVFVVVRGDMTLSEAKLKREVGDVRLATAQEIAAAGASPGYASPVGLKDALVVVDDLIPGSANLAAGANEAGYHLLNTNCGRDYRADRTADLAAASEGDACPECGQPLAGLKADILKQGDDYFFEAILYALAEAHHDEKGLAFPSPCAPFDVYLMHLAGKQLDTRARAGEMYTALEERGLLVLFDDRDERAGVKFNDADLIGLPLRVTLGEKNLVNGMVEVKARTAGENQLVPAGEVLNFLQSRLPNS
jgi:prolyl-tRNA synthetase